MTPKDIKPGQKFGHWEIIKYDHTNEHRVKYFLCKCDVCGTMRPVRASALLNGTSTACSKACSNSLLGLTFGEWTVLKRDKSQPRNYICRCSCGRVKSVFGPSLKYGTSKQCGCKYMKQADKPNVEKAPKEWRERAKQELTHILNKYNISFKTSYQFYSDKISFDFALFNKQGELIGLIENNGSQHYSARGTQWNTPERLIYTQKHEYIKQKFAEDNKIPLLIIPYQYFDDIEKFLITSDFWQIIIKNFND